ncbi:MAG TPA: hypothetical protein VN777_03620 [Terriglobales bacterium]|nr:hypothetical protein [Terriglobales bacterium]
MTRGRVIFSVLALGFLLQIALLPTFGQVGGSAKKNKAPRALGLLELAPNGKARLIPITILIDGKYYDASAYKADPVPMALWSTTVYEAVHTGVSLGLFTVTGALQRKDENGPIGWVAEGTWQTADSIKAKAAKKKPTVTSVPRGMNEDEGPPVLRRAGSEKPKPPEPPPAPATPPQAQPAPTASPSPSPAATSAAVPASAAATASANPSPQEQAQDQPPEDKDRPALKRGKAGAESAEEAQKKAAASAKASAHTAIPASGAMTPGTQSGTSAANQVQLIPAISDSNGPDPLPYTYNLKPEEEQQFRKKMLAMAADEIRTRASQQASAGAAAEQPVHAPSPRSKATAKPVQPVFEDVQLQVFDLADINEPELILTAKARMPQSSREKASATPNPQYLITLVVREDVNGVLHKALANVTDAQHMDVIPRLDLIDAVDVDGDGRAELLFREVSDTGSAFVIYRVIGDRLYPLFQGTL